MVEKQSSDCCGRPKKGRTASGMPVRTDSGDVSKSAKIIIMGNSRVSKTCIIRAFMENASMKGRHIGHTNNIV